LLTDFQDRPIDPIRIYTIHGSLTTMDLYSNDLVAHGSVCNLALVRGTSTVSQCDISAQILLLRPLDCVRNPALLPAWVASVCGLQRRRFHLSVCSYLYRRTPGQRCTAHRPIWNPQLACNFLHAVTTYRHFPTCWITFTTTFWPRARHTRRLPSHPALPLHPPHPAPPFPPPPLWPHTAPHICPSPSYPHTQAWVCPTSPNPCITCEKPGTP